MDAEGYGSRPVRALCSHARVAGVCTFECYSSIMAEAFYRALGFRTVEPMEIALGGNLTIPSVRMLCQIAQPST